MSSKINDSEANDAFSKISRFVFFKIKNYVSDFLLKNYFENPPLQTWWSFFENS